MRTYKYKKVNAFTSATSKGNPAAYLSVGDTPLTPEEMLSVGREHAGFVSEVVFCAPSNAAACKLTYYSSQCEVDFCGHGTVATMYDVIANDPKLRAMPLVPFETNRKGILTVYNCIDAEGAVYVTAPAAQQLTLPVPPETIAQALGLAPSDLDGRLPVDFINAGLRTLLIPVAALSREISLYPSEPDLKEFCAANGVDIILIFCMETKNERCFAHTRVFAPRFGYLEDPATGSGNSAFANYLLKYKLWNGEAITVEQGGDDREFNPVMLKQNGGDVLFGGAATVVIDGTYFI